MRLNGLIDFSEGEVENGQRISLAAESFGLANKINKQPLKIPSAAGCKCIFYDGNHFSYHCFKEQRLVSRV